MSENIKMPRKKSTFNPVMLSLAMDIRGLTVEELAERSYGHISARDIQWILDDYWTPGDGDIHLLASILYFPDEFFHQEGERHPTLCKAAHSTQEDE